MDSLFSVPNNDDVATLLVCRGDDCLKKRKRPFDSLVQTATDAGLAIEMVRCQGACSGPTAVVLTSDGPRWFEKLKGAEVQLEVCAMALNERTTPSKRLRGRELRGKQRAKAAKRLAKQRG